MYLHRIFFHNCNLIPINEEKMVENEPKNKQKKYVPRIEKDNQNSANSPKEFICFCPHFVQLKNS